MRVLQEKNPSDDRCTKKDPTDPNRQRRPSGHFCFVFAGNDNDRRYRRSMQKTKHTKK